MAARQSSGAEGMVNRKNQANISKVEMSSLKWKVCFVYCKLELIFKTDVRFSSICIYFRAYISKLLSNLTKE